MTRYQKNKQLMRDIILVVVHNKKELILEEMTVAYDALFDRWEKTPEGEEKDSIDKEVETAYAAIEEMEEDIEATKKTTKPIIKERCCLCNQFKENVKYINCKKKGIQNVSGKYGMKECNKPVCIDCCGVQCPFCTVHRMVHFKGKGPKRKKTFAEAEDLRQKKFAKEKLMVQIEEDRRIIKLKKERKQKFELLRKEQLWLAGYLKKKNTY